MTTACSSRTQMSGGKPATIQPNSDGSKATELPHPSTLTPKTMRLIADLKCAPKSAARDALIEKASRGDYRHAGPADDANQIRLIVDAQESDFEEIAWRAMCELYDDAAVGIWGNVKDSVALSLAVSDHITKKYPNGVPEKMKRYVTDAKTANDLRSFAGITTSAESVGSANKKVAAADPLLFNEKTTIDKQTGIMTTHLTPKPGADPRLVAVVERMFADASARAKPDTAAAPATNPAPTSK